MKLGESKKLPELRCLDCDELIDGATCVEVEGDRYPEAGDVTVCLYCGHLMMFDFEDDLMLRDPTDAELLTLAGDKRILEIQTVRGLLKKGG